ncbi:MAG: type 4a pilus biogenesis protein PilO [Desulfomonile sp.]
MFFEDLTLRISVLQKNLLIAAGCFLLLGAFYLLVVSGMSVSPIQFEIVSIKSQIAEQETIRNKGMSLKRSIETYRGEVKTLIDSLPEKQHLEILSKQIDRIASESGIEILKLEPAKEKDNEELPYFEIPFQLILRGDYRKLGAFMGKLNNLPGVINVPQVIVRPRESDASKRTQAMVLDANIRGMTYRRLSVEEIKNKAAGKQGIQVGESR